MSHTGHFSHDKEGWGMVRKVGKQARHLRLLYVAIEFVGDGVQPRDQWEFKSTPPGRRMASARWERHFLVCSGRSCPLSTFSLRFWSFLSLSNFILSAHSSAALFGLLTSLTPQMPRNHCSQVPITLTSWTIPVHGFKRAFGQQVKCYRPMRLSGPSGKYSGWFLLPLHFTTPVSLPQQVWRDLDNGIHTTQGFCRRKITKLKINMYRLRICR